MSSTASETLAFVVEREMPFPPEEVWPALTQPALIEKWLMIESDIEPVVDHSFTFHADLGPIRCRVLAVEPNRTLSYTCAALEVESVVTWTLTPTSVGCDLRLEHSGFRMDQQQAYQAAKGAWPVYLATLEQVLAQSD